MFKKAKIVKEAIMVNDEESFGLLNGLIDLNRDILMRIIKMVEDEKRIRNIIGMNDMFYGWTKQRIFRWARFPLNLSLKFLDNPKAGKDVTINKAIFTAELNDGVWYCFFLEKEMIKGIFNIVFDITGFVCQYFGVARRSVVPCLHDSLNEISGLCGMYYYGLRCGYQTVAKGEFISTSKKRHIVMLELDIGGRVSSNMKKNKLYFFVDGEKIPHVVVNIPQCVHFMFGVLGRIRLEVVSFRQLVEPSPSRRANCQASPSCDEHEWE